MKRCTRCPTLAPMSALPPKADGVRQVNAALRTQVWYCRFDSSDRVFPVAHSLKCQVGGFPSVPIRIESAIRLKGPRDYATSKLRSGLWRPLSSLETHGMGAEYHLIDLATGLSHGGFQSL